MDDAVVLRALAVAIILAAARNSWIVGAAIRRYQQLPYKSRLLRAFLFTKVAIWVAGFPLAIIAVNVALDREPLPFGGLTLGIVVVVIMMLPGYIHREISLVEAGIEGDDIRQPAPQTRDQLEDTAFGDQRRELEREHLDAADQP